MDSRSDASVQTKTMPRGGPPPSLSSRGLFHFRLGFSSVGWLTNRQTALIGCEGRNGEWNYENGNGNGNGNGNRNGNGNGNGNGTWTGTNGYPKAIVCSSPLFGQLGSRINAAVTFMERDTIVRTGRLRFSPLPPPPPSPHLALRLLFRLRVRLRLSLEEWQVAALSKA